MADCECQNCTCEDNGVMVLSCEDTCAQTGRTFALYIFYQTYNYPLGIYGYWWPTLEMLNSDIAAARSCLDSYDLLTMPVIPPQKTGVPLPITWEHYANAWRRRYVTYDGTNYQINPLEKSADCNTWFPPYMNWPYRCTSYRSSFLCAGKRTGGDSPANYVIAAKSISYRSFSGALIRARGQSNQVNWAETPGGYPNGTFTEVDCVKYSNPDGNVIIPLPSNDLPEIPTGAGYSFTNTLSETVSANCADPWP